MAALFKGRDVTPWQHVTEIRETIREQIEIQEITQTELAIRTDRSRKAIRDIVNGNLKEGGKLLIVLEILRALGLKLVVTSCEVKESE